MGSFFSLESPLYKFMTRLLDMLKLNFLWLLTGGPVAMFLLEFFLAKYGFGSYRYLSFLPLVLIGPATTAVFSITLRMVDEQEGYIGNDFFSAYRENFKKGMIIGVIMLVAAYAVWLDFQFYHAAEALNKSSTLYLVLGIVATVLTFLHLVYAFPLQARYENSIINTLRNSYSITIKFIVKTVFMVVILALLMAVFKWNSTTQYLGILIGPASIMLTISGFAIQAFRLIENENERRENSSEE